MYDIVKNHKQVLKSSKIYVFSSVQFTQSRPTLCDPMNRSTPGLPVHRQLPEFTQTHIHRVRELLTWGKPRTLPRLFPHL